MDKLNMNTVTVQCGINYATIESRVKAFRSEHENGQILTELVKNDDETGEVIFKAHAVVDGVIRGTGHAMEMRGSSNINKTSHIECAETSAVGRCLAMLGYIGKSQISSYEEIENARLQIVEMKKNERKLKADISSFSIKYKKAIDEKNEVVIDECREEIYDNPNLWKEVNKLLSTKQRNYIYSLNEKARDEREIKKEIREAGIKNYAKEFVEKQKIKKLNG